MHFMGQKYGNFNSEIIRFTFRIKWNPCRETRRLQLTSFYDHIPLLNFLYFSWEINKTLPFLTSNVSSYIRQKCLYFTLLGKPQNFPSLFLIKTRTLREISPVYNRSAKQFIAVLKKYIFFNVCVINNGNWGTTRRGVVLNSAFYFLIT